MLTEIEHINCIDAQGLLIRLMCCSELSTISAILRKSQNHDCDEMVISFIELCASFAIMRKQRAAYCDSLESTCRAIVAQQSSKPEADVLKREYVQAMGWMNNVQYNKIKDQGDYLHVENILNICSGFTREDDRRFWRNQLLTLFPSTQFPVPEQEDAIEYEGLVFVIKHGLTEIEYNSALLKLSSPEREKLHNVAHPVSILDRPDPFGDPPYKLYEVIKRLIKKRHISLDQLVLDELQITKQSWSAWKKKWEEWEQTGKIDFYHLPHPRISRNYLLVIAIVCRLEYTDVIRLLQLAGYRLGLNRADAMIAETLIQGGYNVDKLKQYVLNEMK